MRGVVERSGLQVGPTLRGRTAVQRGMERGCDLNVKGVLGFYDICTRIKAGAFSRSPREMLLGLGTWDVLGSSASACHRSARGGTTRLYTFFYRATGCSVCVCPVQQVE